MWLQSNNNLRVFLGCAIGKRTNRRTQIKNHIILLNFKEPLIQISVAEHFSVEHRKEPLVLIDKSILKLRWCELIESRQHVVSSILCMITNAAHPSKNITINQIRMHPPIFEVALTFC